MADLVVVESAGRRWGVPAARVREVAAVSTVTPIPGAPPPVIGLTQLRGQILPVLDLGAKLTDQSVNFGDEARSPRPNDPLLVVELGPARAALWVDRVVGVASDASDASEGRAGTISLHDVEPVDVGALFDQVRARVQS